MNSHRPVVAIVQRILPHYRVRFYNRLRDLLDAAGIELRLVYGNPTGADAQRRDTKALPWAHAIKNKTVDVAGRQVFWQPCWSLVRDADLVIVEQATRLLLNYALLARQATGGPSVAFWGHGRNLQGHTASRVAEAIKATISKRVRWWFAYNALSKRIVEGLGVPPSRITDVQNAIDTRHLREAYTNMAESEVDALRQKLGVEGRRVGLFVGGMYAEKRLPFLIEACRHIRSALPDFEMLWLGGGPDEEVVRSACRAEPWMHYVGPVFDTDRVPYFRLADALLMPGLVGLVVLDAFALETPLVTTDVDYHSPEIEYLEPEVNGAVVRRADDAEAYAAAVVRVLRDDDYRRNLVAGGLEASQKYTVEEMARRFAGGIEKALIAEGHLSPESASSIPILS